MLVDRHSSSEFLSLFASIIFCLWSLTSDLMWSSNNWSRRKSRSSPRSRSWGQLKYKKNLTHKAQQSWSIAQLNRGTFWVVLRWKAEMNFYLFRFVLFHNRSLAIPKLLKATIKSTRFAVSFRSISTTVLCFHLFAIIQTIGVAGGGAGGHAPHKIF